MSNFDKQKLLELMAGIVPRNATAENESIVVLAVIYV
jgi:hypothetical protein